MVITIRELTDYDWALWRNLRLAALADAPDAFASTLAEWTGAGDVEVRWRARLVNVPFNVVADRDSRPIGMASGTAPIDGEVQLISMWVTPERRACGVGEALVEAVVRWAGDAKANGIALDVRQSNQRAIRFYLRNGFFDHGWSRSPDPAHPERRMVHPFTPESDIGTCP
jgi:ribosomal protein S18 acetylase RimI-like enzyme